MYFYYIKKRKKKAPKHFRLELKIEKKECCSFKECSDVLPTLLGYNKQIISNMILEIYIPNRIKSLRLCSFLLLDISIYFCKIHERLRNCFNTS